MLAGRLGAEATAKKLRGSGLSAADLGALESHADAKRWLEAIGRAVCTGQLADRAATAAIRAVEAWLKAHADETTSTTMDELEEEVRRLKAQMGDRASIPRRGLRRPADPAVGPALVVEKAVVE